MHIFLHMKLRKTQLSNEYREQKSEVRRVEPNLEIKRYLEAHGISQTYISRKTGIELPKLNFALNGKRRMTLDEYALICYALGVGTEKFLKPRAPVLKGE